MSFVDLPFSVCYHPGKVSEARVGRHSIMALLTGASAGLLGGLMGVGGGLILVPMLVGVLKLPQHKAHATSLASMIPLAVAGVVPYAMKGHVDWGVSLAVAAGTCIGVVVGARLMVMVPARRLRQGFGVLLLLAGLRMVIGMGALSLGGDQMMSWAVVLAIGLVAGVLSGMLGIGGGMVMIPGMVLFAGIAQHMAQGISLAVIIPTTVVGSLAHHRLGNMQVSTALWIAPTAAAFALGGAWLAGLLESVWLTRAFGLLLLYGGVRMVLGR